MRKNRNYPSDYAVSEIVGGMLLLVVAIVTFASIYTYLYPPPPDYQVSVKIEGMVDSQGEVMLEHKGGESLTSYQIYVRYPNGSLIGTKEYNENWNFGERIYPLNEITEQKLTDEEKKLWICVYTTDRNGNQEPVFDGILNGKTTFYQSNSTYGSMLISSLRTDSSDEDLICFTHTINQSLNPSSYIYKWIRNGASLNDLLLPFDTENNSQTRDYSDNENHGNVVGATWSEQGIIGGCYYFEGAGDYIEHDLPTALSDVTNNDFSISLWLKSDNIDDDQRVIWEGGIHKNFGVMFQYGTQIHFGICYNNGIQDSVRTENLTSNTWYHIVGTWDASEKLLKIYLNGDLSTESGDRTFSQGGGGTFDIGHGMASSRFWKGYIDEFQLFDRVLSEEQIYQMHLCQKDGMTNKSIIASEEINTGETWQCIVIPNDGSADYKAVTSNTILVKSYTGGE